MDVGFWVLDLGFWILDVGSWVFDFGFGIWDCGSIRSLCGRSIAPGWILSFGFEILGSWIMDFGFRILGSWILDFGSWKMCAVWILQKSIATTRRFGSADIRCLT